MPAFDPLAVVLRSGISFGSPKGHKVRHEAGNHRRSTLVGQSHPYDKEHFTTYMRLLDASADDASEEEMAQLILGIDPALEPERARKAVRSHLDRANWLVMTGYKELNGELRLRYRPYDPPK
ncbi:Uncharacterized conserved protein [Mesorhizobium albiziae]|uniref:Uncharacterized conserved protein n=1 Tax=Neomesorhizobium albiziae TaxID=335020 RepID=A0A1I4FFF9_9HYPH|nr:hypothetical protein GCM10007937_43350 [Mesorhizobium albiziae]SFL16668.1 Uncharacterized conserved protein [Mesorhizobium albiziae]